MYKVILKLDNFFLKYEGGGQLDPPPGKTTFKKPSFIKVKNNSTHGCPVDGFHWEFVLDVGPLLKSSDGSFVHF